ncbi:MAG: hypothetical protein HOC18_08450, partial [Candidatus Marinimicrobia bacterium]|nr:hypothetical protein [Candidatus Neomarinimicrobiota bacterium]
MIIIKSSTFSKPSISYHTCKGWNRNMALNKSWKILFFTLLFISLSFADDNRLRLKKANVLENKTINGEAVKFISGNVIFTKGSLTLNCQEGRHYEKNELAILYRRV